MISKKSNHSAKIMAMKAVLKRAILPSFVALILCGVVFAFIYVNLPELVKYTFYLAMTVFYLAFVLAWCGWLFLFSLLGLRTKAITLSDEFGEETTYWGAGAVIWGVLGVALAILMFAMAMTLPGGLVIEWLWPSIEGF
ncbi:MAG: hypothetical protein KJ638_15345 [Chloroflexi bacterium]|nr:hypothetical protein [Chloroflexota bacterium]